MKILLVDDEPGVRRALRLVLADEDVTVVEAASASEALSEIARATFDVLVVDKNLPGMSGIEIIRNVRQAGNQTRCIVITGFASADSAMETLELGIDAYLEKPFDDVFAVAERIRQIARRRRVSTPKASALRVSMLMAPSPERTWFTDALPLDDIQFFEDASALKAAVTTQFPLDLVIVDTTLEPEALVDFLSTLADVAPNAAFAVALSRAPFNVVTKLIALGTKAVFVKPYSREQVEQKMKKLLRDLDAGR